MTQNCQSNPEEKEQSFLRKKNITLPDFRHYYKAIVIKQHGVGTKTDIWINGTD